MAAATGSTEEACRKRVGRAVERLRHLLLKQGVTPTVAGLTVVLAAERASPAPAAVAAAAGGGKAAPLLAKGTLATSKWSRIKTAAVLVPAVGAAGGVVWMAVVATGGPRPAATTRPAVGGPPEQPFKAAEPGPPWDAAKAELDRTYALSAGEVIRVIRPPFSPARAVWADFNFPYAEGAANIRSLGFTCGPSGLTWTFMSYADQPLDEIVSTALGLPWYRVDGLNAVPWQNLHGDLVVRDGATSEQKLAALAGLITRQSGTRLTFVASRRPRLCVVLRGETRAGPDNGQRFRTVVLTQTPLSRDRIVACGRGERPAGSSHAFDFGRACKSLAAPFFEDPDDGSHGSFHLNSMFLIGPDAMLDPAAAGYEAKLRRVVDNVQAQIGGDWRIESREIESFRLEPAP